MYKRAVQALKRTFMHVSGLPHHVLKKKNQLLYKMIFSHQNMVGEDLRHA